MFFFTVKWSQEQNEEGDRLIDREEKRVMTAACEEKSRVSGVIFYAAGLSCEPLIYRL